MSTRLNNPDYLKFPLTIGENGGVTSSRSHHVREQIEQVLFTAPGERWFRREFGVGARALVFEPNNHPLWEVTKKRLMASLGDALSGEVDPATLEVTVEGVEGELRVNIAYRLATINYSEKLEFVIGI